MANKLRAGGQIQDKDRYIRISEAKEQMIAMLTETQTEIEELKNKPHCCEHYVRGIDNSSNVIQQKINALKENKNAI